MDLDPELEVTLSDGQEAVTFQILAVDGPLEAWAITEPRAPFRVVRSEERRVGKECRL